MTQWTYNYINYYNLRAIRNTVSGRDLNFIEDKIANKLYINFNNAIPAYITLEYVPKIQVAEDVVGDYWVDILKRLSLAYAKIAVGRARTRYVQSGALWSDDGSTILQEGTTELQALRERLVSNSNYMNPLD